MPLTTHAARLARRRDNLPARAHTECVRRAARRQPDAELVVRRAERGMARRRAVLAPVDVALQMLDARADGERLARHRHAEGVEHLKRVPRAVADRQHDVVRVDRPLARRVGKRRAHNPAAVEDQARQLRLEADRSAVGNDRLAQVLHHGAQPVGADVRLREEANLLRRAHLAERLQHLAAARIVNARIQLAVGKRPRAALAELHVALGLQRAAAPKRLDVAARASRLAALDHQRRKPRLRQPQRREQPRRPQPDHQRRAAASLRPRPFARRRGRDNLRPARQPPDRAARFDFQRQRKVDVALVPRVPPTGGRRAPRRSPPPGRAARARRAAQWAARRSPVPREPVPCESSISPRHARPRRAFQSFRPRAGFARGRPLSPAARATAAPCPRR